MDPRTFEKFRELIYAKSGIHLAPEKATLVASRISKRMRALEIDTPGHYFDYVVEDRSGQELVQLLDAISTNFTSFYREPVHIELMAKLLSEWAARGQRRFRLWSAASSSGEEPYTMGIAALEALAAYPGCDLKILATDISTRMLERCMAGVYDEERVKPVPRMLMQKYFDREDRDGGSYYRVNDLLRRVLVFRRFNLSETPFKLKGPLDIVFCRNVMIYFDNTVRTRLVNEVHRILKPGGYLMIGHSESLNGLPTPLESVRPAVYMK
ncbi:MAG: methyltransferase domain-containing protein [Candidatus Hydrogenedens sp.]|nr:methyltransferase domain-containing protein [Candidatus Hydrogenedens sp.]